MKFNQAKNTIDLIVQSDYQTTKWEDDFIESILNRKSDLSFKQAECLDRIYNKSCK